MMQSEKGGTRILYLALDAHTNWSQVSATLAWLLDHGCRSWGLHMSHDIAVLTLPDAFFVARWSEIPHRLGDPWNDNLGMRAEAS